MRALYLAVAVALLAIAASGAPLTPGFVPAPDVECKPADAVGDKDCLAAGGHCFDSSESGCQKCSAGKYVAGKCGGGTARQCCMGKAYRVSPTLNAAGPPPPPPAPGALRLIQRLNYDRLTAVYPVGDPQDVKKRIGGGADDPKIVNTCALRMSATFNAIGMPLTVANTKGMYTVTSSKSGHLLRYALRVKELGPWVLQQLGPPSIVAKPRAGQKTGVDKAKFAKYRGIIQFTIQWSDATGHFDLWDGSCMFEPSHTPETERYFSLALQVALYAADAKGVSRRCE
jgi:hypothetical protein